MTITAGPTLRASYVTAVEGPRASTASRAESSPPRVAATTRVALHEWLDTSAASSRGLVVPSGSLPDLLRSTLEPLVPALDTATPTGGRP